MILKPLLWILNLLYLIHLINIFNKHNKIRHVGYFFHYINNIKKYLQKVGLMKKQNIETYERVINLCKSLLY